MKHFFYKYKHIWTLSYIFIYVPWFFLLERTVVSNYTIVTVPFDFYIPFQELFIIPYLLWFAYICFGVLYLFFTNVPEYYRCCVFLFIGMTICLFIYGIWPNGHHLRPSTFERDNILVTLCKALYTADTATNVCPSIHVFNSIGVHIALSRSQLRTRHPFLFQGSFLLCCLICLSTVLIKQHSIFDGVCAIILSLIMYLAVYKIEYDKLFSHPHAKDEKKELS